MHVRWLGSAATTSGTGTPSTTTTTARSTTARASTRSMRSHADECRAGGGEHGWWRDRSNLRHRNRWFRQLRQHNVIRQPMVPVPVAVSVSVLLLMLLMLQRLLLLLLLLLRMACTVVMKLVVIMVVMVWRRLDVAGRRAHRRRLFPLSQLTFHVEIQIDLLHCCVPIAAALPTTVQSKRNWWTCRARCGRISKTTMWKAGGGNVCSLC